MTTFIQLKRGEEPIMDITTLGLDIAKNVFQLHGVNQEGKVVLTKQIKREKLAEFIVKLPPCLIGMEACGGSNYWSRKFQSMGHRVKLMGAQFVKPYVKSNKNDACDAEAICEGVARPNMRFVASKTIEQQDIQMIHRIRALLVKNRTALVNQIRGLLAEYGVVIAQGINHVRKQLLFILEDADNELIFVSRDVFFDLRNQLIDLDKKIEEYDNKIERISKSNEICKRLLKINGVGPLIATAMIASIGDATIFKNGREMAAFIGLVPKQYSSGGKQRLLGISKRGDRYLRCLLIHGARAVLFRSKHLPEKKQQWINAIVERRGRNRAICAIANKNARIIWAVMAKNEPYDSHYTEKTHLVHNKNEPLTKNKNELSKIA